VPASLPLKPNIDRSSAALSIALAVLRGYKLLISPLFMGSCRFVPSCADYTRDALMAYGVIGGGWLAAKRVSRCHPFCHGGFDPVPPVPVSQAKP